MCYRPVVMNGCKVKRSVAKCVKTGLPFEVEEVD